MQRFYKGRTNNHLTWVMVDATDFATPESALSAAMTIKIYGKLRGGTGTNFVSSGTGSLTNDITHVGASATGIYTIALAKADLSDASAAWYDQYVIVLAGTGAAQQTLIVDGGIDASALSAYQSRLSDIASALLVTQSMASDAASAATQANSRVLLVQSLASDAHSAAILGASHASDAHSAALIAQSLASDAHSAAVVAQALSASDISDLRSAIAAGPAATITASDISDIASAVWANTIGARVDSRVLVVQSLASDAHSAAILGASHASDAHSAALLAQSLASDAHSAAVVTQSHASDIYSLLSDLHSDVTVMSGIVSDIYSNLTRGVNVTQLNGTSLNGDGGATPWGP